MKAIIGHPNLDFDALASMVAARKLYPDAVLVTVGKIRSGLKDFMAIHGDFIEIRNYIDKREIDTLIMVDTRSVKRLGEYGVVLENDGVRVIVYDHHDDDSDDVAGATIHYEPVGANVTQLVERLREGEIAITAEEATLFALGIYDDTGSLRFSSTTSRDVAAVAYLLERGAKLPVVAEFTALSLNDEQSDLFTTLLRESRVFTVEQRDILIATATTEKFVSDLAVLTMKLKETFATDAVFTVVKMEKTLHIVGRSSVKEIDVRAILKPYDGRGHIMAASARVKDAAAVPADFAAAIEASLGRHIAPAPLVKDIMSSPVKTIDGDLTVNEVGEYLLRYGHSGYPVMKDGKLAGIITRRDIEKCKYHGLGNVPAKGYMSSNLVTATPTMTVAEVKGLMVEHNIGRLPVLNDGEIVGIVSRTDLMRLLYGDSDGDVRNTYTVDPSGKNVISCRDELARILPEGMFSALGQIAKLADDLQVPAFLVGGLVRDLLMGRRSVDLDIVVEGDGIAFAESVAGRLEGTVASYAKFGTATVTVGGVIKIDIAGARREFYEYPAAKPSVEESSLKQDLFRRDFTINAMALSLNHAGFGQLIDYYNGRGDLAAKTIRVLHNLSFVEDPTRVLRALRFEVRYGFHMDAETRAFAEKAVADGVVAKLSRRRLWHEIQQDLAEPCAYGILKALNDFGLWGDIFPEQPFSQRWEGEFAQISEATAWLGTLTRKPDLSLVRCLLLLFPLDKEALENFFLAVQLPHKTRAAATLLKTVFYLHDSDEEEMTELEWYNAMAQSPVEVLVAAYIKATPTWRKRMLTAFRFYREHRIECDNSDIRALPGYVRGSLNELLTALLQAKKRGEATTKEEELAFLTAFLAQKTE